MIFDHAGNEVSKHQLEHEQILPRAGWVEHNPVEIWERCNSVVQTALNSAMLQPSDLAAVGITNQRETSVVWNKRTGRPYHNAIVWQDTRTDRIASALDREGKGAVIREKAGLPPATYFSGGKIHRDVAELIGPVLGWDNTDVERELEHYEARVAAERESQHQVDDLTADATRLGAPDVRRGAAETA